MKTKNITKSYKLLTKYASLRFWKDLQDPVVLNRVENDFSKLNLANGRGAYTSAEKRENQMIPIITTLSFIFDFKLFTHIQKAPGIGLDSGGGRIKPVQLSIFTGYVRFLDIQI